MAMPLPPATWPLALRVAAPAASAAARVHEVFAATDAVTDVRHARTAPTLDTGVHHKNVCFAYQPAFSLLTDFTLDLPVGDTVCLFGPSGAGKSTVIKGPMGHHGERRRNGRHDDDHIRTRSRSRR